MASTTLVPVSEYLKTTYRPDCDYVDGRVVERNLGEKPHAKVQGFFCFIFRLNGAAWRVRVVPEQRVQVRPDRYRVPDICVERASDPDELIVRHAPLLCIEVLSSNDTLADIRLRAEDYWAMGVRPVWAANPWKRRAYHYHDGEFVEPQGGMWRIEGTPICVNVSGVFAKLDG